MHTTVDGIPVRWRFEVQTDQWWRTGFWLYVDLKTPKVCFRFLWWMFGFGRFIDWKNYKGWTNSTFTYEDPPSSEELMKAIKEAPDEKIVPVSQLGPERE